MRKTHWWNCHLNFTMTNTVLTKDEALTIVGNLMEEAENLSFRSQREMDLAKLKSMSNPDVARLELLVNPDAKQVTGFEKVPELLEQIMVLIDQVERELMEIGD